jgi:protein gp37
MGKATKIHWCDSTCNPTMGCDGCELWAGDVKKCYAGTRHGLRGSQKGFSPSFNELTLWTGRMAEAARWRDLAGTARDDKPWLDGLPRLVFISDMSDALSAEVTFEFLETEIIAAVSSPEGRRHQWLWLTKRPERMAQFSDYLRAKGVAWPANLWAGTSVTTQATTGRIEPLLRVGGGDTIRFLSVEPQLERIDLSPWLPRLDWVIQGGESGAGARPFDLEWAHDLIRQCRAAGVPYFLKQLGSAAFNDGRRLRLKDRHGGDWMEWPEEALRVREMPERVPPLPVATARAPGGRMELTLVPNGQPGPTPAGDGGRRRKRREAALTAWQTRRANAPRAAGGQAMMTSQVSRAETPVMQTRSVAARKAWATRRSKQNRRAG